jgi:hypothetical protein
MNHKGFVAFRLNIGSSDRGVDEMQEMGAGTVEQRIVGRFDMPHNRHRVDS